MSSTRRVVYVRIYPRRHVRALQFFTGYGFSIGCRVRRKKKKGITDTEAAPNDKDHGGLRIAVLSFSSAGMARAYAREPRAEILF